MRDPRLEQLAVNLLEYSNKVEAGQHVLIKGHVLAKPLIKELIKHTYRLGAYPHVEILDDEIARELSLGNTEMRMEKVATWNLEKYKDIDAFISVFAEENDSASSDVLVDIKVMQAKALKPVSNLIVNTKEWVLLNYPTASLAQKAKMSLEQFEDFLLAVCLVDYSKMNKAMQELKKLMERTDRVRITGPGTDLMFSIKGIDAVPCAGECNIPDGEVFTAPVRESVNGVIQYNTPSPYQGTVFNNVRLEFKDGKIINATADNDIERLNEILNTDEGARYVGEFAIGVNPLIKHPMGDILFDEKIDGSLHFTPGQAYEGEADNGNRSAIHWDLVLIQRDEYGGGAIYFDDVLIRKNGRFVLPELECLNPENLI
ncbi:MAG: aminopeptidase [Turicibacter sp.]|nr:aminopeptidase [Turicibacter sp.]